LGSDEELSFTRRTAINDYMFKDPDGEVIINTRGRSWKEPIPVLVLDMSANPDEVSLRNW